MSKKPLFLGPWLSSMNGSTFSVCSMPNSLNHEQRSISTLLLKSSKALVCFDCFKMLIESCSWSTSQRLEGPSSKGSFFTLQVDRPAKEHFVNVLEGLTGLCVEYTVLYSRSPHRSAADPFGLLRPLRLAQTVRQTRCHLIRKYSTTRENCRTMWRKGLI